MAQALQWNTISLEGLQSDPNISVKIATEIERLSWIKSPFASFVGKGGDRGVRVFEVEQEQPFRPRLKAKLTGTGVEGNADFETNYDQLEILSQTVYPRVVGNSLRSPIKQYSKMQHIDFVREATDSLGEWIQDRRDKNIVAAITNDFTNVVVADSTNGYKDTTNERNVQSATKKIVAGDVMNVKMIRRAIFMARAGVNFKNKESFPLKPIKSDVISEGNISIIHNSYIVLLDSFQADQLRSDKEWIEMQKYAGDRGDKNRLFSGLLGFIDGCVVLDMNVWTSMQVGMLNTDISDEEYKAHINPQNFSKVTPPSYYADAQPLSFGALIGSNAVVMVGGEKPVFYIDDKQDAGRKTTIGADRLLAIAKGRFDAFESGSLTPFSGQDFAVIGLVSSKE
ncbi:DUF4043 family protein [Helicobacter jaachi]|uniref:DUF4043 family protein n=1 Tax=Helicobacter jaachi TaxID=1677920 RepID=A0A4U8T5T5_9HELI|nr:DUF4043 family protein [Helicobacter jaachi]TLD94920.1 DUF4043 family protein [Helicobacter jaachi]